MKKVILAGVMLILGFVMFGSCARKAPIKIEWAASLEEALKIASEKDKPIIADFWSDG